MPLLYTGHCKACQHTMNVSGNGLAYVSDDRELIYLQHAGERRHLEGLGASWIIANLQGRLIDWKRDVCLRCGQVITRHRLHIDSGLGCSIAMVAGILLSLPAYSYGSILWVGIALGGALWLAWPLQMLIRMWAQRRFRICDYVPPDTACCDAPPLGRHPRRMSSERFASVPRMCRAIDDVAMHGHVMTLASIGLQPLSGVW